MRVQILSDLHLEFSEYFIENINNAELLILSGDVLIGNDFHEANKSIHRDQSKVIKYRNFLKSCSQQYKHVVYVPGNHEFYHGRWCGTIDAIQNECNLFDNIHFLERNNVIIDDYLILGATLWTDMNKRDPTTLFSIRKEMMDYKYIRNDKSGFIPLKPMDTVDRHHETLDYFKSVLYNNTHKVIIATHHGPSHKSIDPAFIGDTIINGAYVSDLSNFILDNPNIVLWTGGHTHHAYQYNIGNTQVVCNPRGYQNCSHNEQTGWDPNLVIEV